jgi:hypothetical protein
MKASVLTPSIIGPMLSIFDNASSHDLEDLRDSIEGISYKVLVQTPGVLGAMA